MGGPIDIAYQSNHRGLNVQSTTAAKEANTGTKAKTQRPISQNIERILVQ
jgi:hypothetical protein